MRYYHKITILYLFACITLYSQAPPSSIIELIDGYPVHGGFDPLCLDYDGDGTKEFVYNSNDQTINMVGFDLSMRNDWPAHIQSYANSVSAGDVTGDGNLEIVFSEYEKLHVLDTHGNSLPGFPIEMKEDLNGLIVLEDLDGDGACEIITATSKKAYVFNKAGEILDGWPNRLISVGATQNLMAVGDMDQDGFNEIIGVGLSSVKVWKHDGTILPGWESVVFNDTRMNGDLLIGDLDNDGMTDITFYAGYDVGLLSYSSNGQMRQGFPIYPEEWPQYGQGWGALGDLNNDNLLEIIMVCDKYLYAFDCYGNKYTENYPIVVQDKNYRGPSVADITGDNIPEILYGDGDGFLYLISADGYVLDGFPQHMGSSRIGQLQLGDFNNDGFLDLLFDCDQIHAYSFDVHLNKNTIQWGVWAHDSRRTSNYSTKVSHYQIPESFVLPQNYPNPFNISTTIRYELLNESFVKLSVYDILGREVDVLVNGITDDGIHLTSFNGENLSSGVYLYRIQVDNSSKTKKMLLLK